MPNNCAVMYQGNTELAVTKIDIHQGNIPERPLQDIGIKLSLEGKTSGLKLSWITVQWKN